MRNRTKQAVCVRSFWPKTLLNSKQQTCVACACIVFKLAIKYLWTRSVLKKKNRFYFPRNDRRQPSDEDGDEKIKSWTKPQVQTIVKIYFTTRLPLEQDEPLNVVFNYIIVRRFL